MGVTEMEQIGALIARAVVSTTSDERTAIAAEVDTLVAKFPAYPRG
jgi:glycine/serine hydroxymethyltransferase